MATGDKSVDSLPDADQEEDPTCIAGFSWREESRGEATEKTDASDAKFVPHRCDSECGFERIQPQMKALAPSVPVERTETEVNRREASAVDDHQLALL